MGTSKPTKITKEQKNLQKKSLARREKFSATKNK